jgi:alpha-1,2-mannosyltransferase
MDPARRRRLGVIVGATFVTAYALAWIQLDSRHAEMSDFTAAYGGASMLRTGLLAHLYDLGLQQRLIQRLIAPTPYNLPFVNPPPAALLVVPFTWLPLVVAFRLWAGFQLVLLGLAAFIALRAADPPDGQPLRRPLAFVIALAPFATFDLMQSGQWDGLFAIGLALAYWNWKRGNAAAGSVCLVATFASVKPHLVIPLLCFLIGWRQRRAVVAAAGTLLALGVASIALVGTSGIAALTRALVYDGTVWQLRNMSSLVGIFGALFGNGPVTFALELAALTAVCVLTYRLGIGARRAGAIDSALACATVLALLAAPHAYTYDLTILVPVIVWTLVRCRESTVGLIAAWIALAVCSYVDFLIASSSPLGTLAPYCLVALAWRLRPVGWQPATAFEVPKPARSPSAAS